MTAIAVAGRQAANPLLVLARIELLRLVRHPAFIGFAALTLLMHVIAHIELSSQRANLLYDAVANGPRFWVPAAVGLAIASGLAATRARRNEVVELVDTAPVTGSTRSDALVLAVIGLGVIAAAVVLGVVTLTGGWNGYPFLLDPERTVWVSHPLGTTLESTEVTPSLAELAAGPAGLVTWALFGIVVARFLGSRVLIVAAPLLGFIQLIVVTWTLSSPTRWLWPFTHSAQYVGWLDVAENGSGVAIARGFNIAATAWHLLYLTGVVAVLAVAARWHRPLSARSLVVAVAGVAVAVVAGITQIAVYTPDLHSP